MLGTLSYVITATTEPLKQKLNEAQGAMHKTDGAMKKTSQNISESAKNMGTSDVEGLSEGIGAISPAAGQAVGGFKKMSVAARAFNAAMGPIGLILAAVGLAVAALTSYFRGSVEGQQKMAKIMAYVGGLADAVKDLFIDLGKRIMWAFESPQDAIKQLWEVIKQNLMNRFQGMIEMVQAGWQVIQSGARGAAAAIRGIFNKEAREEAKQYFKEAGEAMVDLGKAALKATTGITYDQLVDGAKKLGSAVGGIGKRASENMKLQERENQLQMDSIDATTKLARLNAQIAEARRIANDDQGELTDQIAAQNRAMELVAQKYALQEQLAAEELAIQRDRMALGHDTIEDMEKEADLHAKLIGLQQSRDNEMRNLLRRHGTLMKQQEAEAQQLNRLAEQEAEARTAILEQIRKAGLTEIELLEEQLSAKLDMYEWSEEERLRITEHYQEQIDAIRAKSHEEEVERAGEMKTVWEDFGSAISGTMGDMASMIGATMAGAEADFRSMAASALDSIGKIINARLAEAIAGMIAGEASKGLLGLVTAGVGIGAIKALFSSNVPKMAKGGIIPGSGNQDTYPAMLMPGEAVIPPKPLDNLLRAMNTMVGTTIAAAGTIARMPRSSADMSMVTVRGRLAGDDIMLSNERAGRRKMLVE